MKHETEHENFECRIIWRKEKRLSGHWTNKILLKRILGQ